jgi:hypothetical protein
MAGLTSVAISDAVLAAAALTGVGMLTRRGRPALDAGAGALALIGVAAAAGAAHHGLSDALADAHATATSLAGFVGIPLIGAAYAGAVLRLSRGGLAGIGAGLVAGWLVSGDVELVATGVGAAGMISVFTASAHAARRKPVALVGAVGAVGVAVAGLVIGTEGPDLFGLLRVDAYHYLLAVCALLLAAGLRVVDHRPLR